MPQLISSHSLEENHRRLALKKACLSSSPHCLKRLDTMRRWLIGDSAGERKMKKQGVSRPPLDRAHRRIALKYLMRCGGQQEREKRRHSTWKSSLIIAF